jgi:hypothetical protein
MISPPPAQVGEQMGLAKDDVSVNAMGDDRPERIDALLASGELDLYACGHLVEYANPTEEFSVPFLTDRLRLLVRKRAIDGPALGHMLSSMAPLIAVAVLSYIRWGLCTPMSVRKRETERVRDEEQQTRSQGGRVAAWTQL